MTLSISYNFFRIMASAHKAAIDQIESIVKTEKIDCDFQRLDGYLFLGQGHKEDLLAKEMKAAEHAGLQGVEWLSNVPVSGFQSGPALRFPNQGQLHPVKYLAKLAKLAKRNGVKIFTNSHVMEVKSSAYP
jgi:glycine/D-amino acid oxidase-like deaminating enzyme